MLPADIDAIKHLVNRPPKYSIAARGRFHLRYESHIELARAPLFIVTTRRFFIQRSMMGDAATESSYFEALFEAAERPLSTYISVRLLEMTKD